MEADPFATIRATLNALPFVRWDRLTRDAVWVNVYGWIDRTGGRADFVLVIFYEGALWTWTSSSAERSHEIHELLLPFIASGPDDREPDHVVCERVEDVVAGVTGAIRL